MNNGKAGTVRIDFSTPCGRIKPLNATNNGPVRCGTYHALSNFDDYRAARIPYARTHDSALGEAWGPHAVDVSAVFPSFDADPDDPANYDFAVTDAYLADIVAAGTGIYYRLGQSIENSPVKKYHIYPPADYRKWAVICEHIIRHYTEGWADGYLYENVFWEIWNEPDLTSGNTWGGTEAQFFDFFEVAAKYLKARFPHQKIGGPALAGHFEWLERFLAAMQRRAVPLDFISWHDYGCDPHRLFAFAQTAKEMAARYGYGDAEMHLTEWNYIQKWGPADDLRYSMRAFRGQKGGAYVAACMALLQRGALDKMFYYDARVGQFNGMFDEYLQPLPAYYALSAFSDLAELGTAVKTGTDRKALYAAAAANGQKGAVLLSYFDNDDGAPACRVTLSLAGLDENATYRVTAKPAGMQTEEKTFTLTPGCRTLTLDMALFDVFLLTVTPQ